MAEQPTDIPNQQTADDKEEETQSPAEDHVFVGDGNKQEETVAAQNDNQKHPESKQDKGDSASLSACTNGEMKSESRKVLEPACVENTNTAEKMALPAEQLTFSENKNSLTDTDSTVSPQPDDERDGCFNRDIQEEEQPIMKVDELSREDHSGKEATQETTSPSSDEEYHRNDVPKEDIEDSKETTNTNTEAERDVETIGATSSETDYSEDTNTDEKKMAPPVLLTSSENKNSLTDTDSSVSPQPDDERDGCFNRDTQEEEQPVMKVDELSSRDLSGEMAAQETTSPQSDEDLHTEHEHKDVDIEDSKEVEAEDDDQTVGDTSSETAYSGGNRRYLLILGLLFLVLALVTQMFLHPESLPQKNDEQQVDIFLRQMEKVMTQFPRQRPEVWKRSRIHLLRHLQTAHPTEPVSLILTAGLRAEKTLHCLAQGLAFAFSAALNASVLQIDGASKASQDSDLVKLDIDRNLQGAFEGDKPVAVIHRFEELPPGSTLIFYRYCDHENAAYKKTFLIFTVLLGDEQDIPAQSRLSAVEEMVDDHLQKKFLSDSHPVSYDKMDLDKYGGLWSRISHLILPVAAEKKLELHGCGRT